MFEMILPPMHESGIVSASVAYKKEFLVRAGRRTHMGGMGTVPC